MRAPVVKVRRFRPERSPAIIRAAALLRAGGLVAFPTETVYGLAADAFNPEAVKRVFAAKGRPSDNPLIVHIADPDDVSLAAKGLSEKSRALMRRFWPGPLTLILSRKKRLPGIVSAQADTVAVRIPDDRIARALIRAAGTPLVGPSANLSGRPSPTRAQHVAADLRDRIDLILDGGRTHLGIESTVMDMTVSPPALLRFGAIAPKEIEALIGKISLPETGAGLDPAVRPRSPGMKYRHYAPRAELVIIDGPAGAVQEKIQELINKSFQKGRKAGIISFRKRAGRAGKGMVRYAGSSPEVVAKRLFSILRDLDKAVDLILCEHPDERKVGRAVADRLMRAAGYRMIRAAGSLEDAGHE